MNPDRNAERARVVRYSVDLPVELYDQLRALANKRGSTLAIEIKRATRAHLFLCSLYEKMSEAIRFDRIETSSQERISTIFENGIKVPIELLGYTGYLIDGQDPLI